jgi:hypothetical protein
MRRDNSSLAECKCRRYSLRRFMIIILPTVHRYAITPRGAKLNKKSPQTKDVTYCLLRYVIHRHAFGE